MKKVEVQLDHPAGKNGTLTIEKKESSVRTKGSSHTSEKNSHAELKKKTSISSGRADEEDGIEEMNEVVDQPLNPDVAIGAEILVSVKMLPTAENFVSKNNQNIYGEGFLMEGKYAQEEQGNSDGMLIDDEMIEMSESIVGSGDRAYHLALIFGSSIPSLRPLAASRTQLLPALRPSSQAECQRRCGTGGFCDPSSNLGCGGEYCVGYFERL